jgi:molybdate transport system substrate-binding protein
MFRWLVASTRNRVGARASLGIAIAVLAAVVLTTSPSLADDVHVAVAANFAGAMQRIAADFARDTGHSALVTSAATGTLYSQIRSGAPFDLLLAADDQTPSRLENDGLAVLGSRFTYALGKLVLWSARADLVDDAGAILRMAACEACGSTCPGPTKRVGHIAIANPRLAPYGAAALEVLGALDLRRCLEAKLVLGESVAQAMQFVATANADLGFVALSQVRAPGLNLGGSLWLVPARLYSPIRQQAVLLRRAEGSKAAVALLSYLKRPSTQDLIRSFGYGVDETVTVASAPKPRAPETER